MTTLKGMTWSHPRGFDPLVACSAEWHRLTGVNIQWEKRSLQDFESYPVEDLARAFDLIVIDHPHVGQITREGCIAPLDLPDRAGEFAAIAEGTVGPSFASYEWQGRQWAFPIDAATQVQAWMPDQIETPAQNWDEVLTLARRGRVLLPLRPPHSLMVLYALAAHLGRPCTVEGPNLLAPDIGAQVWGMMRELCDVVDPACAAMDPIAAFEHIVQPSSRIACVPLIYGYISYAVSGFRSRLIRFSNIPVLGDRAPIGSALGGTGIAVSARSPHSHAATDFAYWVACADVQRKLYARSGGQAGHAAAWEDDAANSASHDFYRATRATLEGAWLRPRHDGYMAFQAGAAEYITSSLAAREAADPVITHLNRLFQESF